MHAKSIAAASASAITSLSLLFVFIVSQSPFLCSHELRLDTA